MVAYFTIEFTNSHVPKGFSTGPDVTPTHWKQTIFTLQKNFSVETGDLIDGTFGVKFKEDFPRQLEFEIKVEYLIEDREYVEENFYIMH